MIFSFFNDKRPLAPKYSGVSSLEVLRPFIFLIRFSNWLLCPFIFLIWFSDRIRLFFSVYKLPFQILIYTYELDFVASTSFTIQLYSHLAVISQRVYHWPQKNFCKQGPCPPQWSRFLSLLGLGSEPGIFYFLLLLSPALPLSYSGSLSGAPFSQGPSLTCKSQIRQKSIINTNILLKLQLQKGVLCLSEVSTIKHFTSVIVDVS